MDIHAWLQHIDNRDPPEQQTEDVAAHRHVPVAQYQHAGNTHGSPLLAEGIRRRSRARDRSVEQVCAAQRSGKHGTTQSTNNSIDDDSRSPSTKYRRKPRRKTRDSRYVLKTKRSTSRNKQDEPVRRVKRCRGTREETGIVQNFELNARSREHRLTLEPNRAGLFSRGKNAPVMKHKGGMPDLSFNELNFLQRSPEFKDIQYRVETTEQSRDRIRRDEEITTYLAGIGREIEATPDIRKSTQASVVPSTPQALAHPAKSKTHDPFQWPTVRRRLSPVSEHKQRSWQQRAGEDLASSTSMLLPPLPPARFFAPPPVSEAENWQSSRSADIAATIQNLRPPRRRRPQVSSRYGQRAESPIDMIPNDTSKHSVRLSDIGEGQNSAGVVLKPDTQAQALKMLRRNADAAVSILSTARESLHLTPSSLASGQQNAPFRRTSLGSEAFAGWDNARGLPDTVTTQTRSKFTSLSRPSTTSGEREIVATVFTTRNCFAAMPERRLFGLNTTYIRPPSRQLAEHSIPVSTIPLWHSIAHLAQPWSADHRRHMLSNDGDVSWLQVPTDDPTEPAISHIEAMDVKDALAWTHSGDPLCETHHVVDCTYSWKPNILY